MPGMVLSRLSEDGNKTAGGVIKEIANESQDLFETRNKLIHATWSIGLPLKEEDIDLLIVEKWKVDSKGFQKREDLPRNFTQLRAYQAGLHDWQPNWQDLFNISIFVQSESNTCSHAQTENGYSLLQNQLSLQSREHCEENSSKYLFGVFPVCPLNCSSVFTISC
jgi:hypothetical protein